MWFGESEANVREVFDKARAAAPCILFFDELDSIAKARGGSLGDAGGAGDRVMNQLLTEMDGVTAQKLVFFIGATNRPDILDPAMMRPGRLDSLIYIGLPDFDARVSVFKACMRKTPVDPDVDWEFFADRTEGFSGADISGVCKAAARNAIRGCIAEDRKKFEAREAKKKACEEKGEGYVSDDEAPEAEQIPYITKAMMLNALSYARRSVTKADLEKYMKYKRDMERKLGMDDLGNAPVVGLNPEGRHGEAAHAPAANEAAPRNFGGEAAAAEAEDDDIYD
jgi:transitional endoplasmic reticulum ATPase